MRLPPTVICTQFGIFFWGLMANHNKCVSHSAIGRDEVHFFVGEEKDSVGSFSDAGFPLC
jgi:hypothetical protein